MSLTIGHRGAKGHVLENTLESFAKAIELNADAVELDIYRCKSGELIVFHDKNLSRFNDPREIEEMTLDEIRRIRLEEQFAIPTLKDVLLLLDGKIAVNIELKGFETNEALIELLQLPEIKSRWANEKFIISSFHWEQLRQLHALFPSLKLGILLYEDAIKYEAIHVAKELGAIAIHPHFHLCSEEYIKEIHRNELLVYPWTVNEIEEITLLIKKGVDGIISDYPDRVNAVKQNN